jgi:uncharacterized membrane protein
MKASEFLSEQDKESILAAINSAEHETSGEIRIHMEMSCKGDILDCAAHVFKKLGMHNTKERNGVLIYIAIENRKFAIIGDAGINSKVPADFWESTKNTMTDYFKKNDFVGGITHGIKSAGEHLKKYFPHKANDVNELPDDISYGL